MPKSGEHRVNGIDSFFRVRPSSQNLREGENVSFLEDGKLIKQEKRNGVVYEQVFVEQNKTKQASAQTTGDVTNLIVAGSSSSEGDITGITAGTGLSGGGATGNITLNIDSTVATLTGTQTLTNKTLTSPVINTGVSGSAILDSDTMSGVSATTLSSSESIKAYVDTEVAGLVDSAPDNLNTLNELAAALDDNADILDTLLVKSSNLSDLTNASTARSNLGLGSLAELNTINGALWSGTDLAIANGGTGASTADVARENLGLEIGIDVQAHDAGLLSIATLTTSADKMIYTTASDTYAVTDLTSTARTLLDDTSTTAMRATLGLGDGAVLNTAAVSNGATTLATGNAIYDHVTTRISGKVDTSGSPVASEYARFTDSNTIEGRSYAGVRTDLGLNIGTNVLAYNADLQTIAGLNPSVSENGKVLSWNEGNETYEFSDKLSPNGTTANGLLTYNTATIADVEQNLTFTGNKLNIESSENVVLSMDSTSTFTFLDLYNDNTNRVQIGNARDGDFIIRTADAERFTIDKTTGFVGVGTNDPTYRLDVGGDIGVNQYIYHNADTDTFINFTADRVRINAGGSTKFDSNNTYVETSRSITPVSQRGISGGGDLSADRTIELSSTQLASVALTTSDQLILFDQSDSDIPKRFNAQDIFDTISGAVTSYTNTGNDRVLTSGGGTTINGESNLTFTGSALSVTGTANVTSTISTDYGVRFNNGNTDFMFYNNTGDNLFYLRDLTNSQMLQTWTTTSTTIHKNLIVDSGLLTIDDGGDANEGGEIVINPGTSHSAVWRIDSFYGHLRFFSSTTSGEQIRLTHDGNLAQLTGTKHYFNGDGGNTYIDEVASGQLRLVAGGTEAMKFYSSGAIDMYGGSTTSRSINIGANRSGNGYSWIDLVGDATYTNFGARFIRGNGGANTSSEIIHRGTGTLALKAQDAGSVRFYTSNTERVRIDSSGNMSIGNVAPSASLHINTTNDGSLYFTRDGGSAFSIEHDTSQLYFYNRTINEAVFLMSHSGPVVINQGGDDAVDFRVEGNTDANLLFTDASTDRVGIGTNSPGYKLSVENELNVFSSGDAANPKREGHLLRVTDTTDNNPDIEHFFVENDGLAYGMRWLFDGGANIFSLYRHNNSTSGNEVLRFSRTSDDVYIPGNVGIGVTSPAFSWGTRGIEIQGSGVNPAIRLDRSDSIFEITARSNDILLYNTGTARSLRFGVGGGEKFRINSDGNAYFYQTAIINTNNSSLSGRDTGGTVRTMLRIDTGNNILLGDSALTGQVHMYPATYAKISTNHGVLDIGPMNTSHCHYSTDRANHWFNQMIYVNGGVVSSYNSDLSLRRNGASADRIDVTDTYSRIIVNNTERFRATTGGATVTGTIDVSSNVLFGSGNIWQLDQGSWTGGSSNQANIMLSGASGTFGFHSNTGVVNVLADGQIRAIADLQSDAGIAQSAAGVNLKLRRGTNDDDRIEIEASETKIYGDTVERVRFGSYGIRNGYDGTNSAPAYSFKNDTNTGMRRNGSGVIDFINDGIRRLRIEADGDLVLSSDGSVQGASIHRIGGLYFTWDRDSYGTNTHHAILCSSDDLVINSFDNVTINLDTNNNDSAEAFQVRRHATDLTSGELLYSIDQTGNSYTMAASQVGNGSAAAPSLSFFNDTDLGFYRNGANNMRFSAGNSIRGTWNGDGLVLNGGSLGVNVDIPTTDGVIRAGNDVIAYYSSDERLKENVKPIENAIDKVSKIRGVEFDWIVDKQIHDNEGHDVGVIAQEVEKVLPEVVQTRDNGYKAVKYEKIVSLLIEAVNEQQQQINELKEKLNG